MGSVYPMVLPEPVLAMPMTSRPLMIAGSACAWIGYGAAYPSFATTCSTRSASPHCDQRLIGRGHRLPRTVMLSHQYARLLVLRVDVRRRLALGWRLVDVGELLDQRVHGVVATLHDHLLRPRLLSLRLRGVRAHRREELEVVPRRRLLAALLLLGLIGLALGVRLGRERRPRSLVGLAVGTRRTGVHSLHGVPRRRGPRVHRDDILPRDCVLLEWRAGLVKSLGEEVVHVVVAGAHALPVEVAAVHGSRAHL